MIELSEDGRPVAGDLVTMPFVGVPVRELPRLMRATGYGQAEVTLEVAKREAPRP